MATMQDLQEKIASLKTGLDGLVAKQTELGTEMTAAFTRLEQKIASGVDTQPAIDALAPLAQTVADNTTAVESLIAQSKVEGV